MKPKVSICCRVYNHGKYLKKCLNSLLSQQTTFPFEIIVHDDASKDNSQEIIKEYQQKYGDIIVPILQTENKYGTGIDKLFIYPIVKGKYIAYCEGDDYWQDEHKLQQQHDILEKYVNCRMCIHRVAYVTENGEYMQTTAPASKEITTGEYTDKQILKYMGDFFHISSFFAYSEDVIRFANIPLKFRDVARVGDKPLFLYLSSIGNVYFIDKKMSCYRQNSVNGWTVRLAKGGNQQIVDQLYAVKNMYDEFNVYTNHRYNDYCLNSSRETEYQILKRSYPYRECLKAEYFDFLRKESFKNKIRMCILALFPNLYDFINKRALSGYDR